MTYLLDTNILFRLSSPKDPLHATTTSVAGQLMIDGNDLVVCPQAIIEFRAVATRPVASNGLGLDSAQVAAEIAQHLKAFPLVPDTPAIFPTSRHLVHANATIGKQNHDARIMASAIVGGCNFLLTFNTSDFTRYSAYSSVILVDPKSV